MRQVLFDLGGDKTEVFGFVLENSVISKIRKQIRVESLPTSATKSFVFYVAIILLAFELTVTCAMLSDDLISISSLLHFEIMNNIKCIS